MPTAARQRNGRVITTRRRSGAAGSTKRTADQTEAGKFWVPLASSRGTMRRTVASKPVPLVESLRLFAR